jgi:hypothetical protein
MKNQFCIKATQNSAAICIDRKDLVANSEVPKPEEAKYFWVLLHDRAVKPTRKGEDTLKIANNTGHWYSHGINLEANDSKFYGKIPKQEGMPIWIATTKGEYEEQRNRESRLYEEQTGEKILIAKVIPLSAKQWTDMNSYADTKQPDYYQVIGNNCTEYVQELYNAAGLPGFFTQVFTQQEQRQMKSLASKYSLHNYGSGDHAHRVEAPITETRESFAKKLHVSPERIKEVSPAEALLGMSSTAANIKAASSLYQIGV